MTPTTIPPFTQVPIGDGLDRIAKPESAPATDLMKRVVQGAHDTVDRLAHDAAPAVQRMEQGVSHASDALKARAEQARVTRQEWTESVRGTVRDHPLVSLAAALAIGAVVARIAR